MKTTNSNYVSLFVLIKSLTKGEKTILLKNNTKDALYIKLFRVLDSMTEYDEEKVIKKSGFIKDKKHLENVKQYLYQFILDKLAPLNSTKSRKKELLLKLLQCQFLFDKGLYVETFELSKEIIGSAQEAELYEIVLEAQFVFLRSFGKQNTSRSEVQRLGKEQLTLVNKTLEHVRKFHEMVSYMRVNTVSKFTDESWRKLRIQELESKKDEGIDSKRLLAYVEGQLSSLYIILGDYDKFISCSIKAINYIKELYQRSGSAEDFDLFVFALLAHARMSFLHGKFGEDYSEVIEQIRNVNEFLTVENRHYKLRTDINELLRIDMLIYSFNKGDVEILEKESEWLFKNKYSFNDLSTNFYIYQLASFYYLISRNYKRAFYCICRTLDDSQSIFKIRVLCAEIINLVISYESNSFSLESDIRKLEYKIKQINNVNEEGLLLAQYFIRAIKKNMNSPTKEEQIKNWVSLRDEVEKVSEKFYYKIFNVAWWEIYIYCKIEQQPFVKGFVSYMHQKSTTLG